MNGILVPADVLQQLLDAADAGISSREEDSEDTGAETVDRAEWALDAMRWYEAATIALGLLRESW